MKVLTELGSLMWTTTCDSFFMGLESIPNMLGKKTAFFFYEVWTEENLLIC